MFKKLEKKFVIVNMLMISAVILISFATIHCLTYINIQNQNKLRMESISTSTLRYMQMSGNSAVIGDSQQIPGEYLQGFGLIINSKGEYVFDSSFGAVSKEELLKALQQIIGGERPPSAIVLLGQKFQCTISTIGDINSEAQQLYQITFLNVTDSYQTLIQLLSTFVLTGVITLIAIFGISVYFAKQSIIPIEQSYIQQKQFIQDASHELKTPLASIRANLDAVKSNPDETVYAQQKWLGFIDYEVERMTKLVGDLLYLARSEYDNVSLESEPIHLSQVIENAIASIEVIAFEKQLVLKQQVESGVSINGNQDKVEQVVKILFDNALKYTNDKGAISVKLEADKNWAIFTVSNTGIGISKKDITNIFDRFYRADTSRKHDGSYGLGLAIAKSLVEGMAGEILVSSIPNEITTFIVKFNCE